MGLRRFATLGVYAHKHAADYYASYLEGKGITANPLDVFFVMWAVQVFCTLHDGLHRTADAPDRAEKAIRWGLANAPAYLEGS